MIDDVDDFESQLDMLLPQGSSLNASSLVIATSRDRGVLQQVCNATASVQALPDDQAKPLFLSWAFLPNQTVPDALAALVPEVVKACAGLPLTLKAWTRACPLVSPSFQHNIGDMG